MAIAVADPIAVYVGTTISESPRTSEPPVLTKYNIPGELIRGEVTIYRQGDYRRTRQYLSGHHPELGILDFCPFDGSPQTIREFDAIEPLHTYKIVSK